MSQSHPVEGCKAAVLVALHLASAWMCVSPLGAQNPLLPDSTVIVPGPHYEAGGLYRAFMGAGYRDLWTTGIKVPIADLSTLAGGLTPVRVGGGMTTSTLHLQGQNGRRYVFRSVDKVPADLIQEFEGTPIEAIIRDQMSSFHPSGAVIVASLLDAVDVLHPTPLLVVVPDDPGLGVFREEFAHMLVLFEERPDDVEGRPGFAGSSRIVQTGRLFEILEEEPGNRIAMRELLTSRLVDLLVGDRDRSTNNLLWAQFDDEEGGFVWRPVPRDRDQAFVQLDGYLKGLARHYEPRLVFFGGEYPSVWGLTRNAWDIDRNFLVGVSRSEWLDVVAEVKRRLTDEVIDRAVREMPAEHYVIAGEDMARALRERRDNLDAAAEEFYDIVFNFADIHASDGDEWSTVERLDDGAVRVTVGQGGGREDTGRVTFQRTFAPSETSEIRLYMHGGQDRVVITGSGPAPIKIRVVGGAGLDELVDSSSAGSANHFYDGGDGTRVILGSDTHFHRRRAPRPYSWHDGARTLDWGTGWLPEPRVSYDEDRGLVLIAGLTADIRGFMKDPYATKIRIRAGWSFGRSRPILDYRHYLRDAFGRADLRLQARWSGIEIIDFYGYGNETQPAGGIGFHRVDHRQVVVSALMSLGNGARRHLSFGPIFKYMATDTTTAETVLGVSKPYGSGGFGQLGIQAAFELDTRDAAGIPTEGYWLDGGGSFFPEMLAVDRGAFGEIHGWAAFFLSPASGNPTLAVRAGGKKLWGTYPFADAAFIGGPTTVRGLNSDRYAGDASLFGNAEIRVHVARLMLVLPTDFGLFALADGGRVFRAGESSTRWHGGYGGGVWFAPLRRTSTVRFSIARSEGRTAFYIGMGLAF